MHSFFEWWLWVRSGFQEDPGQAGHVQVLRLHQVGCAASPPFLLNLTSFSPSEDLAICVRCRRKMPDDVKILDDPSYKPKPDSTELMGTKKLRLARLYNCSHNYSMTLKNAQATREAESSAWQSRRTCLHCAFVRRGRRRRGRELKEQHSRAGWRPAGQESRS